MSETIHTSGCILLLRQRRDEHGRCPCPCHDPTAGERVTIHFPKGGQQFVRDEIAEQYGGTIVTPAEPGAGDVETLTDREWDALLGSWSCDYCEPEKCGLREEVNAIIATRLSAVRRKAENDRAEQIAQAIEAHAEAYLPTWLRSNFEAAARIARESR